VAVAITSAVGGSDLPALPKASANAGAAETPPPELTAFFQPPENYGTDLGAFRSPLVFADGTPVTRAADWPRRRQEILSTWHRRMVYRFFEWWLKERP
jgi:hypothetical protein